MQNSLKLIIHHCALAYITVYIFLQEKIRSESDLKNSHFQT